MPTSGVYGMTPVRGSFASERHIQIAPVLMFGSGGTARAAARLAREAPLHLVEYLGINLDHIWGMRNERYFAHDADLRLNSARNSRIASRFEYPM